MSEPHKHIVPTQVIGHRAVSERELSEFKKLHMWSDELPSQAKRDSEEVVSITPMIEVESQMTKSKGVGHAA